MRPPRGGEPPAPAHHVRAGPVGCIQGHAAVCSASSCVAGQPLALNTLPTVAYHVRKIGPFGTRPASSAAWRYLRSPFVHQPAGLVWGLQAHELILGFVLLPAASAFWPAATPRLRLTGPAAITVNVLVIVVLIGPPYTAGAAALFYGTSLLLAAAWGQRDCEATIWSNLILRRNDLIGCPTLTPIDACEARRVQKADQPASRTPGWATPGDRHTTRPPATGLAATSTTPPLRLPPSVGRSGRCPSGRS